MEDAFIKDTSQSEEDILRDSTNRNSSPGKLSWRSEALGGPEQPTTREERLSDVLCSGSTCDHHASGTIYINNVMCLS